MKTNKSQNHTKYDCYTWIRCLLLTMTMLVATSSCGENDTEDPALQQDLNTINAWNAGEKVSEKSIQTYGTDRCFEALTIDDALFQRIYKKSFKEDCTIDREDLRYLKVLHRNIQGEILLGEMICNKAIASDLLQIFRQLFDNAYPIERMVLIDNYDADDTKSMVANNSSAFNFRFISGTTTLSNHSKGMAIDINPLYNPYVKNRTDGSLYVEPEEGREYADRSKTFDYKIEKGDLCYRLFIEHGFTWGGEWTSLKDYQHFEKE